MWRDFSVIQILREINFGELIRSKNRLFAILEAVDWVNFILQKVKIAVNTKFSAFKCLKIADFSLLQTTKKPKIYFT